MPHCTEQMLTTLPQLLNSSLAVTKQIVKEIETEYSSKEMDDDLQNEMDEETEGVEEVYCFLCRFTNALRKLSRCQATVPNTCSSRRVSPPTTNLP
jgi:DNA-binding transcriptional regulator GbsR (MarR family)